MARIPTHESLQGPALVACVLATFMYGIGFILAAQYFRSYSRNDPVYVKVLIGAILLSATLQTVFACHQAYNDYIFNFNSKNLWGPIVFSTPGRFMCVYLTTFLAQIFFATRIWTLTHRIGSPLRWFVVPVMATGLLQFIAGSIQVHLEVISADYVELSSHNPVLKPVTAIQGAATAGCDVIITIALCLIYVKYSKISGSVSSIVDKIVIFAIHRAAATSICAILSVALYYGMSGTYRFLIPCMLTGQLYLISTVSVLMSDESLRDESDEDHTAAATHEKETTSEKSV